MHRILKEKCGQLISGLIIALMVTSCASTGNGQKSRTNGLSRTLNPQPEYGKTYDFSGWRDKNGWLHYHHKSDPRHLADNFCDRMHHSGQQWGAKILKGTFNEQDRLNVLKAYNSVKHPTLPMSRGDDCHRDGKIDRINRDQFGQFLFVLHHVDPEAAKLEWKKMEEGITF